MPACRGSCTLHTLLCLYRHTPAVPHAAHCAPGHSLCMPCADAQHTHSLSSAWHSPCMLPLGTLIYSWNSPFLSLPTWASFCQPGWAVQHIPLGRSTPRLCFPDPFPHLPASSCWKGTLNSQRVLQELFRCCIRKLKDETLKTLCKSAGKEAISQGMLLRLSSHT